MKCSLIFEPQEGTDVFINQWNITGHLLYQNLIVVTTNTSMWKHTAEQMLSSTFSSHSYCCGTICICVYKMGWETGCSKSEEEMDRVLFLMDFIHHCKKVYRNCRKYSPRCQDQKRPLQLFSLTSCSAQAIRLLQDDSCLSGSIS